MRPFACVAGRLAQVTYLSIDTLRASPPSSPRSSTYANIGLTRTRTACVTFALTHYRKY